MAKLPSYIKNKLADWVSNEDDKEGIEEENLDKETKSKKKKKEVQPKVIKISLPSFKKKEKSKNSQLKESKPKEFKRSQKEVESKSVPKTDVSKTNAKFNISLEDLKTISTALDYFKKFLLKKGQKNRAEEVEDIDERLYHFIMKMEEAKKSKDS